MKKILFVVALPLLFTACDPEENLQVSTVETIVSNVAFPDTIGLEDSVEVSLNYQIFNDCGVYVGTRATRSENNIQFQSLVKYTFQGDNPCPEKVTTGTDTIRFKLQTKGTYYLLFRKTNSYTLDVDTLVVE